MEDLHLGRVNAILCSNCKDSGYSQNVYEISDASSEGEISYFGFPRKWHPLQKQQSNSRKN
jgi:hypothetical protein